MKSSSTQILLSIIIPFFNVKDKIGKILDCLKQQTDKNFEVIFINDGSTDGTAEIVARENSQIDCDGVRLINQDNKGPAIARNAGFEYARGMYVYFLDADDIISNCLVECLELGLDKGQELPNVIVFGYEVVDNSAGTLANPKFNSWRIGTVREYLMAATTSRVGFGYLWNKFIQRQFIIMSNIHFEKFNYDEDAIFLSQLYLKVQSISFSDDILYQYVQYPNSLTHAKKNYYESVRSLSRLNQVTDELSQEYALFENGLQLRIKLRLVFALVRKKRDLSSDELSIIRALLKSIKSIHQYISIKDQIAALCITVLGVPGVRIIQFFL